MKDLKDLKELSASFDTESSKKPFRSLLKVNKKKYKTLRQSHVKKGKKKLGMWNLN